MLCVVTNVSKSYFHSECLLIMNDVPGFFFIHIELTTTFNGQSGRVPSTYPTSTIFARMLLLMTPIPLKHSSNMEIDTNGIYSFVSKIIIIKSRDREVNWRWKEEWEEIWEMRQCRKRREGDTQEKDQNQEIKKKKERIKNRMVRVAKKRDGRMDDRARIDYELPTPSVQRGKGEQSFNSWTIKHLPFHSQASRHPKVQNPFQMPHSFSFQSPPHYSLQLPTLRSNLSVVFCFECRGEMDTFSEGGRRHHRQHW